MAAGREAVDAYLAKVGADQREALEALRRTIRAAVPDAQECISYQLPAFHQDGALVAYGAWKAHLALYPMSLKTIARFKDELESFDLDKGTIRFAPERPLPQDLVVRIVKARAAENAARKAARRAKPRAG